MSQSIVKTSRFRISFAAWWLVWAFLHFFVLKNNGFTVETALLDSTISNVMLAATVLLVTVSLQYYTPQKNTYGYLFSLCAALCLIWLFSSRFLLCLLAEENTSYATFFSQSVLLRGAVGFLLISQMALIAVLWYTMQEQQETEKRKTEAEALSKDAELVNLQQQLQPHFLFNSLNSINALIGSQPQQARTMIQQLSYFLRGTLKKDQQAWIPLNEELEHLQLYLDIEKVRFGHRLNTLVTNNAGQAHLPVMLLQPLVENAIKFGLYDTTGAVTIRIDAKEENGYLLLQVTNPFDPETSMPQTGTGFGLRSVQRRLYLLFARQDLLITERTDNLFIATIKIPQP